MVRAWSLCLALTLLACGCNGLRDLDTESPDFCLETGTIGEADPTQTDQCCSEDEECEPLFRAVGLGALAACGPDGTCELDCRPGDNCACASDADCADGFGLGCTVADRNDDGACEGQGQMGTGRCTICRECDEQNPCAAGMCTAQGYCTSP